MTTWGAPAPADPEKPDYLHDPAQQPGVPTGWRTAVQTYLLAPGLGLLFAIGFTAMAFQARASWETHRDWVVPVLVPFLGAGGVSMGFLVARRQLIALAPGLMFVLIALGLIVANVWRGSVTEGDDTARDILSILTGVALGFAVAGLVVAVVRVEGARSSPSEPDEA
jgi:peptidoglycan/LPS O-acetylase OafA/YrhL